MITILKLILILTAPIMFLGLVIIPMAAIVSAALRKDKSKPWRVGWAVASVFWLPGFIYGAVFFKNAVARIFTWIVILLTLLTFGGSAYFNYEKENGDIVKASLAFFERNQEISPENSELYMRYLEKKEEKRIEEQKNK